MEKQDLVALVDRLRAEQDETEWLEFKAKRYEAQEIGEYLSALANAACLAGKSQGYLLFGVSDASHEVVGTKFSPTGAKGKGNQPLLLWLSHGLDPNVGFDVHVVTHPDGSVVLFVIGPARDCPVRFYGTAYIRVGSSKTTLSKYPEKERALWSRGVDWSAAVCENATLPDLDPGAIRKAREQFTVKHPAQVSESAEWSDKTLLNKAKVTRQGRITNAALSCFSVAMRPLLCCRLLSPRSLGC